MEQSRRFVAVAAVVLVAVGGVAAFGPGVLESESNEPAETAPETDASPASIPVAYSIDNTSECGRTCRLVNTTVENNGTESLTNVTLAVDIYADGDRVWDGTTPVGTLQPGEAVTNTTRVEVGAADGLKIRGNGGDVTVVTTVRAASGQRTFEDSENVG